MPTILRCQHCGATMAVSRPVCGRCGRPLVFVDERGHETTSVTLTRRERLATYVRSAAVVAAVVLAAVAVVVLASRARPASAPPSASLRDAVDAAARASEDEKPAAVTALVTSPPAQAFDAYSAGYAAFEAGDLAASLDRYQLVLKERPDDAVALNNVGQILVAMGRTQEAIRYLERAAEVPPSEPTYRFNLAGALSRAGDHSRAVEQYRRLLTDGLDDARTRHNLGLSLRALGRDSEAAESFRRATELAPDQAASWRGLALALERLDQKAEAAAAYDRYLSLAPDDPEAPKIRERIALFSHPPEPKSPDSGSGAPR